MPEIRPFRGITYAPRRRAEIKDLVCPPYDVISPAAREALVQRHSLNFVRVELPEGDPKVRYDAAAALWKRWLGAGVLRADQRPAFYIYEARFRSQVDGRALSRRGFFAALRAVPWGQGVFPHEKTLPTPKADRFMLFKALRAQTSPIQLLADDPEGLIKTLVQRHQSGRPELAFKDEAGVEHRFWTWRVDADAEALMEAFAHSPVAIADGHHRYETALAYGVWAKRQLGKTATAGQYVMAYFSSADDEGLEILPTHRAVAWEKRRHVDLGPWGKARPVKNLAALAGLIHGKKGPGVMEIGLYRQGKFFLYAFTKVPRPLLGTAQERFPVAALHAGPLKGLGKEDFLFTRRPEEAVAHAQKTHGWAFLLAPNTVREVLETAKAGMVMPPKSTYFYPKIPSGLLSHQLQGPL